MDEAERARAAERRQRQRQQERFAASERAAARWWREYKLRLRQQIALTHEQRWGA